MAASLLDGKVRYLPETAVPAGVVQTLMRGLDFDPAARFHSMRELLDALKEGLDPLVDLAPSRRARRIFAWSFGVAAAATSVPALFTDVAPPVQHILALPILVLALLLIVVVANCRLLQNPQTWGLCCSSACSSPSCLSRALAVQMGLTLFQYLPIDHVILLGFGATATYRWIPRMWIGVVLTVVSGTLTAISPETFWKVPVFVYPAVALLYVLWWPQRAVACAARVMAVDRVTAAQRR